jgi:hypothetical protein
VQQHVRNEPQQQQRQQQQQGDDGRHCQTVGAVAIDSAGRLAAATSTGGRTNKVGGHTDGPSTLATHIPLCDLLTCADTWGCVLCCAMHVPCPVIQK